MLTTDASYSGRIVQEPGAKYKLGKVTSSQLQQLVFNARPLESVNEFNGLLGSRSIQSATPSPSESLATPFSSTSVLQGEISHRLCNLEHHHRQYQLQYRFRIPYNLDQYYRQYQRNH